jgi:hypothetical protein
MGPMSDESVLTSIKITKSNRFYYWFVKRFPNPKKDIISHNVNIYLTPANADEF